MTACEIPRCRAEADLTYLGHGVCTRHWNELTDENAPPDALRMVLGIEAGPEPIMENTMPTKKNTTKASDPKTEKKMEAKTEKASKKREPKSAPGELRTLAVRVTSAEFDLVHRAAGPRNLSVFMKGAVLSQASKILSK